MFLCEEVWDLQMLVEVSKKLLESKDQMTDLGEQLMDIKEEKVALYYWETNNLILDKCLHLHNTKQAKVQLQEGKTVLEMEVSAQDQLREVLHPQQL
jgi:hypothetical protein